MSRSVIDYIIEALPDRRARFVFPSGVTTRFWARETAKVALTPIAPTRFLAWDGFKAQALSVRQSGKQAINHAIRTLFASNFLMENRKAHFLGEYIPPEYADSYASFLTGLAKLLPALEGIVRRPESAGARDAYFADLHRIYETYSRFLDEHQLFEPAWNRAAFSDSGAVWLLFFPELAEDWEEYREELTSIAETRMEDAPVRIIPPEAVAPPLISAAPPPSLAGCAHTYIHFKSTAQEYTWLALTCRQLLDKDGLCPEDICISAAGNNGVERLAHEFRLYGLFADVRQEKPLPKYPGGRIFGALAACRSKQWSYAALSDLLLDRAFPWKERDSITILMEFGLRYHCVSGFPEAYRAASHTGYRDVDVWEKTFEQHRNQEFAGVMVSSIELFYARLKKDISAIINASSFADLREKWRIFERNHFDRAAINTETATIIGQALASLQDLIEIGERFPEMYQQYAGRAFPIFQSYIQEETYVSESKRRGIPVYAYKVAAGIAPPVHFIINMNQDDAAVVYDGRSSFLREDRKNKLCIQDRDFSAEFIKAYLISGAVPVFTVADNTFSGATVPHRKLGDMLEREITRAQLPVLPDPYRTERTVLNGTASTVPVSSPSDIQKKGWEAFTILHKKPEGIDIRTTAITRGDLRAELEKRLCTDPAEESEDEDFRLSPSDLDEYLLCPFKWVLQRGLGVREKQTEIETLDQRDLGRLYHSILERLWTRIKEDHGRFHVQEKPIYKKYLEEEIRRAIDKAQNNEGYFQKPLYDMLIPRIKAALEDYLDCDAENLHGKSIAGAEYPLRKTYDSPPALSGIADCVLKGEDGYTIRDYKTKSMPSEGDLWAGDEDVPKNVQMASYIAMLESPCAGSGDAPAEDAVVRDARFYSIDNREFRPVIDEDNPHAGYEKEIAAVDRVVEKIAAAMRNGEYMVPKRLSRTVCVACAVSSVCRKPYIGER
ncbi:MAG: PD-(D/E)XK nuclease family protein [Treponema sp.]|jgi:CRISPR/Cas system-associated exonuclease Cas4 (RecB family)|nr:PD-(D/E)XK nuclease family protein [Treponema sp.]